jgi:hypothetical protein
LTARGFCVFGREEKGVMNCVFCDGEVSVKEKIGRRDTCPHCNRDLRCCKQCDFYDSHAYNECREVSAERIVEKERSNYCDYFAPRGTEKKPQGSLNRAQQAKDALEALFKKK